jgi:CDP-4-dehydro-6-deoxyglucose reductase
MQSTVEHTVSSSKALHQIKIESTGHVFKVRPGETILTAALRQGIVLPYSCKNGTCASCKCQVLSGPLIYPYNPPQALDLEDLATGHALTCQAVPDGDVVIEARELKQVADIPVRKLPARVESLHRFTPDIMRVRLKLPKAARLQFLAGQYIDILLPEGKRRAFSIASPPSETEYLELHIKHVAGGGFTQHVFEGMVEKEILRLEGPLGTFFVRRSSTRPMILMGGGTGFAPLKAMIEEMVHDVHTHTGEDEPPPRPITLYWGANQASDLYAHALIDEWSKTLENFTFVPVLMDPDPHWSGSVGFVHEQVIKDHPDLSGFDVYMSGPPPMIHAARSAFLEADLPEDRLFYDSFDFAPDVPLNP